MKTVHINTVNSFTISSANVWVYFDGMNNGFVFDNGLQNDIYGVQLQGFSSVAGAALDQVVLNDYALSLSFPGSTGLSTAIQLIGSSTEIVRQARLTKNSPIIMLEEPWRNCNGVGIDSLFIEVMPFAYNGVVWDVGFTIDLIIFYKTR